MMILILLLTSVDGFSRSIRYPPYKGFKKQGGKYKFYNIGGRHSRLLAATSNNGEDTTTKMTVPAATLSNTSRLSHVMLKVPSVDSSVAYWRNMGGSVLVSTRKKDDENSLRSAFVALGNGEATENCFALELVTSGSCFELGNAISYIGVSMLLKFQKNLLDAIVGDNSGISSAPKEPNAIPVQYSASAPGDYFARLCLHSKNLEATKAFYTDILGMQIKAADDAMLCLRYDNGLPKTQHVPTTLVFESLEQADLVIGNCFDHFVIDTTTDLNLLHEKMLQITGCKVFMKPTEMFGKTVLGLLDPNGYKVILAQS